MTWRNLVNTGATARRRRNHFSLHLTSSSSTPPFSTNQPPTTYNLQLPINSTSLSSSSSPTITSPALSGRCCCPPKRRVSTTMRHSLARTLCSDGTVTSCHVGTLPPAAPGRSLPPHLLPSPPASDFFVGTVLPVEGACCPWEFPIGGTRNRTGCEERVILRNSVKGGGGVIEIAPPGYIQDVSPNGIERRDVCMTRLSVAPLWWPCAGKYL